MECQKQERRYLATSEIRAVTDTEGKIVKLAGIAVVYDSPSENLGFFVEYIKPGAFSESLKTADLRFLVDHDTRLVCGRQSAGDLLVSDTAEGLMVEVDLPDTSYARDLAESVRLKHVTGMSFCFETITDEWETDKDGNTRRTIIKANIHEVSAVTFPAYPETTLALRSLDQWKKQVPDRGDDARKLRQKLNESVLV